jgi:lipoate synthase
MERQMKFTVYRPYKVRPTLESVLNDFRTTLNDLDIVIASRLEASRHNAERIAELTEANKALEAEIAKAVKVRRNIQQLIEE